MSVLAEKKEFALVILKLRLILGCAWVLISLTWGCAVTPKTLFVKDLSRSFEADTIISAATGKPISFEELAAQLGACRVIYVGENHTDPSHHEIQLKIIKAIFERHPSMAVGMEMFDHSYQYILDSWTAGELDEKSFLRQVHWYANWRFNYSLYRDILDFIKMNHIRLVGLNIPFHIPSKIRVGGIENLSAEEKNYLPKEINTSNAEHRQYVESVFNRHHFMEGVVEFDDFYEAQCVWEDTMAENIAANLNDDIMVVMAGNGHIQYKYGIPDRAFRRTDSPFLTIYPVSVGGEIDLDIADFIWVTP